MDVVLEHIKKLHYVRVEQITEIYQFFSVLNNNAPKYVTVLEPLLYLSPASLASSFTINPYPSSE